MGLRQELVDMIPDYHQFDYARLGSFSLTTRDTRYMRKEDTVEYNGAVDSESGHFRKIFKEVQTAKKNPPYQISYSYYAVPCKYPLCRYYDVKRAYLQIARAFGSDVFIQEGKICAYGDYTFTDELFEVSRVSRGLLFSGTAKSTSLDIWSSGVLETKVFSNTLYSPHLRASIQYTLHSILWLLKRWIIYANTDGFIVPSVYWDRVEAWLTQRNISYAIKHEGPCEVKTRGTYKIGDHETATFPFWKAKRVDHIIESHPLWWLHKFQTGKELHS